jgi:opacity protein-like surface antigen
LNRKAALARPFSFGRSLLLISQVILKPIGGDMRSIYLRAPVDAFSNSRQCKSFALMLSAAASVPALLIGASGAAAADLSVQDDVPAIVSHRSGSWAGFYLGASAGWSGADNSPANPFVAAAGAAGAPGGVVGLDTGGAGGAGGSAGGIGDFGDDDALVGLHLGYNWQTGAVVYGVEGDISAHGSLHDLLASLRGRIGYATPRTLFYATAGLAYLSVDGDARSVTEGGGTGGAGGAGGGGVAVGGGGGGGGAIGDVAFAYEDEGDVGFVGGVGVEYKLSSAVSIGLEGLYYTFGDQANPGIDTDFFTVRGRLTMHLQADAEEDSLANGFATVSVANWTGFYVGAHAGALVQASDDSIDEVEAAAGADGTGGGAGVGIGAGGGGGGGGGAGAAIALLDDDLGFMGGLHLGYNWQQNRWVFGLEADASLSDGEKYHYLASGRLRLGYTTGSYLIYGTAGVAFAGVEQFSDLFAEAGGAGGAGGPSPGGAGGAGGAGGDAGFSQNDDDLVGFVVGAGIDAKLTDRVTLGVEGLYYAFDEGDAAGLPAGASNDADVFVLRSRLSYSLTPYADPLE